MADVAPAPDKKFFKDGIRFECQGTGRCCTSRGEYGFVYLTLGDRKRMAKELGLSLTDFTKKHCDKTEGWMHLKKPDQPCQFLDGKRCTVYEGRPNQCRTWPFWPENMNAKTWNEEVITFCPGVGQGKLFSATEIKRLMKMDPIK